jgi:predicted P-loop ATPase
MVPVSDWRLPALPRLDNQDEASRAIQGRWIIEFDELKALSDASGEAVKSFVTRDIDNFRRMHENERLPYPRQGVCIGTTNHSQYLAEDENRRFWPVTVTGKVDDQRIERDRDQIWAEAVAAYRNGEKWWPSTDAEVAMCRMEQTDRQINDSWHQLIAEWIETEWDAQLKEPGDSDHRYVTIEALLVGAIRMPIDRWHHDREAKRIASILKRLGWRPSVNQCRVNGRRMRRWVINTH